MWPLNITITVIYRRAARCAIVDFLHTTIPGTMATTVVVVVVVVSSSYAIFSTIVNNGT